MSDEVQQNVLRWEREFPNQAGNWHLARIESFASSDGAMLTQLADGSILSGGPRPDKDTVTIMTAPFDSVFAESDLKECAVEGKTADENGIEKKAGMTRITAIRLEVLTDPSLPRSGPGRQDNGNLHLSEFEVYVDGRDNPIGLVNSTADFNQSGWEIAKSIDQTESTGLGHRSERGKSLIERCSN